jgi:pimeloyl-ACP methyl ester carboxylesterase
VSRPNPGQTTPDVPAWVIARRIEEFGWLSPEQDETDSRRIRFGYNVTGDLFYPKGTPDDAHLPVVIWLHGSSHPLGYMWVYRRDLHPILALVRAGYAVLAFDQTGFGARQDETASFYERYPKWSRMGRMVEDVRQAIDALEEQPLVDANRVSLFGYTLGGTVGLHAAALDSRIQGVVAISGFTPMRTDTVDRGTGGVARYSHERGLIPRLGFYVGHEDRIPYDFAELIATIAPRPVLIVQPQWGRGAIPEDVRAAVEDAGRVYAIHGAADQLGLNEPSDYVRLPTKTQDSILEWMIRKFPVSASLPQPPAQ